MAGFALFEGYQLEPDVSKYNCDGPLALRRRKRSRKSLGG
jgi:hypothetical protein